MVRAQRLYAPDAAPVFDELRYRDPAITWIEGIAHCEECGNPYERHPGFFRDVFCTWCGAWGPNLPYPDAEAPHTDGSWRLPDDAEDPTLEGEDGMIWERRGCGLLRVIFGQLALKA